MSQTNNTQKSEAERLGISAIYFSAIITGKNDAGYNLAVKLSKEIGGTVELWKTGDEMSRLNRRIVWREYLLKLDREEAT